MIKLEKNIVDFKIIMYTIILRIDRCQKTLLIRAKLQSKLVCKVVASFVHLTREIFNK